ncbi:MAG: patatin-like phospholipase family protein [Bacteroidota bacterium]|nr:patatin-like phospholipase family protein [Bacteroidota bacterium]
MSLLWVIVLSPALAQNEVQRRPKIGLVLSGGGAKGIAHIGVLKVLEKAGIKPDFIGGTSMGSIIGGLYAIGYSADSLEKLVLSQDWADILTDKISRENLSIDEKEEQSHYFITFPFDSRKIKLPGGLIAGQNLFNLLSHLTWNVKNIHDFNHLPIPYLCTATDIVTGEEVVLHNGNLPDAIRASMSIPTVFNPVEIDGRLLVDGGLVNNFPADEVKKMGADIIIGVNVGFKPYSKGELNSLVKITEQSMFFHVVETNKQNQKLCDILISPGVYSNSAANFNHADSLIKTGEDAAMKVYPQLLKLADSLKRFQPVSPAHIVPKVSDSIYITKVSMEGLENVSKEFMAGKIQIDAPSMSTLVDIEKAVDRLYGSQFFEKVTYRIEPFEDGNDLIIRVSEKGTNKFRVGAHYDSDFNASLLMNATLRNLPAKGSKLSLDVILGENPRFKLSYWAYTGWKPQRTLFIFHRATTNWKPDYGMSLDGDKYRIDQFSHDEVVSSFTYQELSYKIFLHHNIRHSASLVTGIENEFSKFRGNPYAMGNQTFTTAFLNFYGFYHFDTYNRVAYPQRGTNLTVQGKFVTDAWNKKMHPVKQFLVSWKSAYSLTERLTVLPGAYAGTVFGDSIPYPYYLFSGGVENTIDKGVFPFIGMNLLQKVDKNIVIARCDLQMEFMKNQFVVLKANVGKGTQRFDDLFGISSLYSGLGLTYGFSSPIGPLELTLMTSNANPHLNTYFNLGYWF